MRIIISFWYYYYDSWSTAPKYDLSRKENHTRARILLPAITAVGFFFYTFWYKSQQTEPLWSQSKIIYILTEYYNTQGTREELNIPQDLYMNGTPLSWNHHSLNFILSKLYYIA